MRRHRLLVAAQLSLLLPACAIAIATSRAADWRPISLVVVLALLAFVSDAATVTIRGQRLSGSLTAFVLLMAFAGPAPAVAVGLLVSAIDSLRTRPAPVAALNNLTSFAVYPLVGALAVRWADSLGADPHRASFSLVVFAVFLLSTVVSFSITALGIRVLRGTPVVAQVRQVLVPLLPAELAVGTLVIGFAISQRFDGTTLPIVAGFAICGLLGLGFVLLTERGRLFQPLMGD